MTDRPAAAVVAGSGAVVAGSGAVVAGSGAVVAGSGAVSDERRWALAAAVAADHRKGVDTTVIDVGEVLAVTDYFVITHGNNPRQVRAITEAVEESLREAGGPSPLRIEGADDRQWVLLDYGAFVVHVFDAERRAFYRLERLWGDCEVIDWRSPATPLTAAGAH